MFRNEKLFASLAVSLISLTAFSLVLPGALAQNNNPAQNPATQKRPPVRSAWGAAPVRQEQPLEYRSTSLDRDVVLPNLPGYTGKQNFISGLLYPNAKDGPGYYVMYNTEHTQEQVKDWWSNALKMDPWKVSFTDARTIKAHAKDGSKCTITAGPIISSSADKCKNMHGSYTVYFHVQQNSPAKAR